jgi:hypothetical protein
VDFAIFGHDDLLALAIVTALKRRRCQLRR